jgi:hypothetical protein
MGPTDFTSPPKEGVLRILSPLKSIVLDWVVALGGLVVSVLATGPKVAGSNPAEDDGF